MTLAGFDGRDGRMLWDLFVMTIRDRFLGSQLGQVWAVLNPVAMLAVFSFVFGVVFRSRLPGADSSYGFLLWLISGYGPWLAFQEGISNGASSVIANSGLIKNLAMKSELIPVAAVLTGIIPLFVSLVFIAALAVADGRPPELVWAWTAIAILLQFWFAAALALFLGPFTVFVRDTTFVLPSLLTAILFLSPIFYPLEAYPSAVRGIFAWSPIYVLSELYRQPLLYGAPPSALAIGYIALLSLVLTYFGLKFFRRLKPHLASRL